MIRVFMLMAAMTALFVVIGAAIDQALMVPFFVLAVLMNFGMYWFSDKVVLKMYRARTIGPQDAPELYEMVDRLRQRAGLPMPTVAIAPAEQPNAFATGRNASRSVVCCTAGILKLVSREELEGVVAHELAHIKHRHMLVGTVAATMAGAIAMVGSVIKWGAIFGMGRSDERGGNPFVMLAMAIVMPMVAMMIQFAISRQNEFQADATAARITGKPMELAGALTRLDAYAQRIPMAINPAAAHLAIVNPLASLRGSGVMRLFSTHPATEDRVAKLQALQADPSFRGL